MSALVQCNVSFAHHDNHFMPINNIYKYQICHGIYGLSPILMTINLSPKFTSDQCSLGMLSSRVAL